MAVASPFSAAKPTGTARIYRWASSQGMATAVLVLLVVAWEILTRWLRVPVYVLPAPSIILAKIATNWLLLWQHTVFTIREILLGFGLSIVVSIPIAVGIVYSRVFERVIYTVLVSLQTIPKIALAPIVVMWFGYGLMPKVLIAFLISFFPMVIANVVGMQSVEQEMIYLARSMGASEIQIFSKIRLPKALPSIMGGLRVGMGQAVIGAVIGEYVAAEQGLGYLQLVSQAQLDTPLLFAAVVVLSLAGVLLFHLVGLVEWLAMPWKRHTAGPSN